MTKKSSHTVQRHTFTFRPPKEGCLHPPLGKSTLFPLLYAANHKIKETHEHKRGKVAVQRHAMRQRCVGCVRRLTVTRMRENTENGARCQQWERWGGTPKSRGGTTETGVLSKEHRKTLSTVDSRMRQNGIHATVNTQMYKKEKK